MKTIKYVRGFCLFSVIFAMALINTPSAVLAGGAGPEPGGDTKIRFSPPPFQGDVEVSYIGYSEVNDVECIVNKCTKYQIKGANIELAGNNECDISFDFIYYRPEVITPEEFASLGPKDFRNWEFPTTLIDDFSTGCTEVYGDGNEPTSLKVLGVGNLNYYAGETPYYAGKFIIMPFNEQ